MRRGLAAGIVGTLAVAILAVATCHEDAAEQSPRLQGTTSRPATPTEPPKRARTRAEPAADDAPAAASEAPPPKPVFVPFALRDGPALVRVSWDGHAAVLQPEGDGEWHDVSDGAARRPIAGLAPGVLLVRREHGPDDAEPQFADTRTGVVRPAFPGRQVGIVAIRDRWVLGHDAAHGELVRAAPGKAPVVLPAAGVRKILAQSEHHVFVQSDAGVLRVPFDGSGATRVAVELEGTYGSKVVPSPSGRLLACVNSPIMIQFDERRPPVLRVVDCESGAELWRIGAISLRVSMVSSSMPSLEVSWPDDDRLRFSESYRRPGAEEDSTGDGWGDRWVEVSAASGARRLEVPYRDDLGISHDTPPTTPDLKAPEWPLRRGAFRTTYADTWFGEDETPAAHAAWAPGCYSGSYVAVSPDGRWAAVCVMDENVKCVLLLDGHARTSRIVHRGDIIGLSWLGVPQE